jgi:hypothetical protein
MALAAVFAGLTTLLVVLAFAESLLLLFVALPFAATTYFLWYHASGRLARRTRAREVGRGARTRRRAAGDGGFGAGARRAAAEANRERARRAAGAAGTAGGYGPDPDPGPSREAAYRALDLDPGADEDAVRRAYRERVKEVHPDRGGDEAEFRRVTRAYDRLSGESRGG